MKKKFITKVAYFGEGKYTVSYCNYYLIPFWYKELVFWFAMSLTSDSQCWSTALFSIDAAEAIASKLKSMKDVDEYYKPMIEERNSFYKRREEYYKNNVPYKIKTFKHEKI